MEYLVFQLYGPFASWGEAAVGESRHSESYPSRSAIVGLLSSALGITRDQEENHQQFSPDHYLFAFKIRSSGSLLKDYHTTQIPDSVGKKKYHSRYEEIRHGKERLGTVLSSREYRLDASVHVSVLMKPNAKWTLKELQAALNTPKFHLYLGRKSNPLALPLDPQLIVSNGFLDSFNNFQMKPFVEGLSAYGCIERWMPVENYERYAWEGEIKDFSDEPDFDKNQVQIRIRHDIPRSRQRWQFKSREEYFYQMRGSV